ncbi:MAG TPA: DUF433 domain-containing protein [Blastocatellia bacterium]|nr:DUF433 domain-containing protein [Blastocatellia bacterium]
MSTIAASLIEIDDRGVARIAGTTTKVIEIAVDKLAHGSTAEEMQQEYPHLSIAQIYAALAHYYQNQAELDIEIERRRREADELASRASDTALREKLIASRKLR